MNPTNIEYLDFTWNPLVGCSGTDCVADKVCWAKRQAKRQKPVYDAKGDMIRGCPTCYTFMPHCHLTRLNQPLKRKQPAVIGTCFSADLFDKAFTNNSCYVYDYKKERQCLDQVLKIVKEANWHWFINLTKQPQNIPCDVDFPVNWVQGVSVCGFFDKWRIDALVKNKSIGHKIVSFEPLYSSLSSSVSELDLKGIDGVIIGAQTHPNVQPKPEWVEEIIVAADAYDVLVFVKNNLGGFQGRKDFPFIAGGCI